MKLIVGTRVSYRGGNYLPVYIDTIKLVGTIKSIYSDDQCFIAWDGFDYVKSPGLHSRFIKDIVLDMEPNDILKEMINA